MAMWMLAVAALAALMIPLPSLDEPKSSRLPEVRYSDFLKALEKGQVDDVKISSEELEFTIKEKDEPSRKYITAQVAAPPELVNKMMSKDVRFMAADRKEGGLMALSDPILYGIVGIGLYLLNRPGQDSGNVGSRADKTRLDTTLSFDDIGGIDEAKAEVMEVVDVMKNPQRYAKVGARVPAGILLCGPPGTGKTLLARVIAAESKLPFLSCSGSDFVEMFVGRGAARVRELFDRARRVAPSLVFIDELDALGKERGRGHQSHDEGEQTLNQLLACMDGIDTKGGKGVVVVAATNRFDVLDEALCRPGRFDRVIRVNRPDKTGRERVLRVHAKNLPIGPDVDFSYLASCTENMSPAELSVIVNEAAIHAAKRESAHVEAADFANALRRFVASRGPQREEQDGRASPPHMDAWPQLLEQLFQHSQMDPPPPPPPAPIT